MHEFQHWMKKALVWCGIPNAEPAQSPLTRTASVLWQHYTTVCAISTHFTFNCNQFKKLGFIKVLTMKNFCAEKDVISNLLDNNRLQMNSSFSLYFPRAEMKVDRPPNACVPHSSTQTDPHSAIQACSVCSEGIHFSAALHNNNSRSFVSI